jgi:hypothetical protein
MSRHIIVMAINQYVWIIDIPRILDKTIIVLEGKLTKPLGTINADAR